MDLMLNCIWAMKEEAKGQNNHETNDLGGQKKWVLILDLLLICLMAFGENVSFTQISRGSTNHWFQIKFLNS